MSESQAKRFSPSELEEFKEIILKKLDDANANLILLQDLVQEANDNHDNEAGGDWFDKASISAEIDLLTSMVARQRNHIQNLEHALVRIQTNTYGICVLTGELISKERLKLVPHATKSVAAKSRDGFA